jgi:hypothetical protein
VLAERDDSGAPNTWSKGDVNQLESITKDAIKYLDHLVFTEKRMALPFEAVLFGRAYVLQAGEVTAYKSSGGPTIAIDKHGGKHKAPESVHKGTPLTYVKSFATFDFPALVLFQDGLSIFFPSDYRAQVGVIHETLKRQSVIRYDRVKFAV